MSKRSLVTDKTKTEDVQEETKVLEPKKATKPVEPTVVTEGSAFPTPTNTREDVTAAIEAIKDGTVQFAGAYHENRRKQCLKDLGKKLGIRNAR